MTEIISIIQNLTGTNKSISESDLNLIRENKDEACAYFCKTLDELIEDPRTEDNRIIDDSFIGLLFLAEWKETRVFKKIQKILHLMGEDVDSWLGDALTENLPHILYQLYDEDYESLCLAMKDVCIDLFARTGFINIAIQLYIDGRLEIGVLLNTMRSFKELPEDDLDHVVITEICYCMAKAHIIEFLPDIRDWIDNGWIDMIVAGGYADYLDIAYNYRENRPETIRTDFCLEYELKYWFTIDGWKPVKKPFKPKSDLDGDMDAFYAASNGIRNPYSNVGRNDPCSCGSGKKYKKCCLAKFEAQKRNPDAFELPAEKRCFLTKYPVLSFDPETGEDIPGFERKPGQSYIEDKFDRESIIIDYNVYLGMVKRDFGFMTSPEQRKINAKLKQSYLQKAKKLYQKKFQKENIQNEEEFDERFSIHYRVREWIHAIT